MEYITIDDLLSCLFIHIVHRCLLSIHVVGSIHGGSAKGWFIIEDPINTDDLGLPKFQEKLPSLESPPLYQYIIYSNHTRNMTTSAWGCSHFYIMVS